MAKSLLKQLTSEERKNRIKQSFLSSKLKVLKTSNGFDFFMKSSDFNQDEKDYILFNLHRLDELSKILIYDFYEEVKLHTIEMNNVEI